MNTYLLFKDKCKDIFLFDKNFISCLFIICFYL